jgi:hypothetical protein
VENRTMTEIIQENSFLILSYPLAKFDTTSTVSYSHANKEIVEIKKNVVKITSVQNKNQAPLEYKFKKNFF